MAHRPSAYQAYLLRLWRVEHQSRCEWRASLQSAHSSERRAFASLEQLVAFLRKTCQSEGPEPPQSSGNAVNDE